MMLDELPTEVLVQILLYSESDHIIGGFSQSCRRLRAVNLQNDVLWKTIYYQYITESARVPQQELPVPESYRSAFFRQMEINRNVRSCLSQICLNRDLRSQAENISSICKYKAKALPILLKVLETGLPSLLESTKIDSLSELYWARQLIITINHIRGSDVCLSVPTESLSDPDRSDQTIQTILNFSYFSTSYLPEPSVVCSVELENLSDQIAKDAQSIVGTYSKVKLIVETFRSYKLLTKDVSFLNEVFPIQELFELARISRLNGGSEDYHGTSPLIAAMIAYTARKCGINTCFVWNARLLKVAFVRINISFQELENEHCMLPEEYRLENGSGVLFIDSTHWGKFRSLEYVEGMIGTENTGGISIREAANCIARSTFTSGPNSLNSRIICPLGSYLMLFIFFADRPELSLATNKVMCAFIIGSCPQAFPVIGNLIGQRPGLYSRLIASLSMAESKFILPDVEVDAKERHFGINVTYRVGDVVFFQHTASYGVIIGWDEKHKKYPEEQASPFYEVVVCQPGGAKPYSRIYVPQDTIRKVESSVKIEKELYNMLDMKKTYYLGKYFLRFDKETCTFVRGRKLKMLFPDEEKEGL